MPIPVTCMCGQSYSAPDKMAGTTASCPKCGMQVQIPAAPAQPVQPMQQQPIPGQMPPQQSPMQQVPGQMPMQQVPGQMPMGQVPGQVPMQPMAGQPIQGAPAQPTMGVESGQASPKKKKKKKKKQQEQQKKVIIIASAAGGGAVLLLAIVLILVFNRGGGGNSGGLPNDWVRKDFKAVQISIAVPKGVRPSQSNLGASEAYRVYRPLTAENSKAEYAFTYIRNINTQLDAEGRLNMVIELIGKNAGFVKPKRLPRKSITVQEMEGFEYSTEDATQVLRVFFWERGAFVISANRATAENNDNMVFIESFKRIQGYGS